MNPKILTVGLGDKTNTATLYYGIDVVAGIKLLADQSVHTICTSPPYYGLRDYGTATWSGGNDPTCEHVADANATKMQGNPEYARPCRDATKVAGYYYTNTCETCGATCADMQIGKEDTPDEFVSRLVSVFREVKRVLRNDGTLWLNLGDSYAANRTYQVNSTKGGPKHGPGQSNGGGGSKVPVGWKAKDLIGSPWMAAFALRTDGWYLRQEIIWQKDNCMPESVTDRCTKSHEHIFLLAHPDSGGSYHYDAAAIREPALQAGRIRNDKIGGDKGDTVHHSPGAVFTGAGVRNKRDVWSVNTKPFLGSHFAVWPEALVEPMVLAGCPEGGVVLDPFSGSGTTGAVATRLGRDYIGIDLNAEYLPLAEARLQGVAAPTQGLDDTGGVGSIMDLFGG